jgi:hypothetical protein
MEPHLTYTPPVPLTPAVVTRLLTTCIKTVIHLRGQTPCPWPWILKQLTLEEQASKLDVSERRQHNKASQFVHCAEQMFTDIYHYAMYSAKHGLPLCICLCLGSPSMPREIYMIQLNALQTPSTTTDESQIDTESTSLQRILDAYERKMTATLVASLSQHTTLPLLKTYLMLRTLRDIDYLGPETIPHYRFQPTKHPNMYRILFTTSSTDEMDQNIISKSDDWIWCQSGSVLDGLPPWS